MRARVERWFKSDTWQLWEACDLAYHVIPDRQLRVFFFLGEMDSFYLMNAAIRAARVGNLKIGNQADPEKEWWVASKTVLFPTAFGPTITERLLAKSNLISASFRKFLISTRRNFISIPSAVCRCFQSSIKVDRPQPIKYLDRHAAFSSSLPLAETVVALAEHRIE